MADDWQVKRHFFRLWLHFWSILGVFGWVLGTPGLPMGEHWAPLGYIEAAGFLFGACRFHLGVLASCLAPG